MPTIAVFGAGSIGCYIGGRLAAAGNRVVLIGRQSLMGRLSTQGLTLSDYRGYHVHLEPDQFSTATEAGAAAPADLVLVTVKALDTRSAAHALEFFLKSSAVVVSLQNGLRNTEVLRQYLPEQTVLAGMVPFNVTQQENADFHQGTEGHLAVEYSEKLTPFLPAFANAGLPLEMHEDMRSVQWAKLLLNLNNAVNTLSGLPLKAELSQRDYRRVLAAAQREAIDLLKAHGQELARLTHFPTHWLPSLLDIPDPVFRIVANKMLAIDPLARSSMQDDMIAGRKTEIDYFQGEVIALARAQEKRAPVNEKLLKLVHAAENGERRKWSGMELLSEIMEKE